MKAVIRTSVQHSSVVLGKSLLLWNLEALRDNGVDEVYLIGPKFEGEVVGLTIRSLKDPLLGSGGALSAVSKLIKSDFLYIPEPVYFNVDLARFARFHKEAKSWLSILAGPVIPMAGSFLLRENENGKLVGGVLPDEKAVDDMNNLASYGLYLLSPSIFYFVGKEMTFDFVKDLLMPARTDGLVSICHTSEFVRPLKEKETIEKAISSGLAEKRNLKNKQKAIFLDRDGTVNHFGDFVVKRDMMVLEQGAAEALRLINESEYLPIVATNQPIVARGLTTIEELEASHRRMEVLLGREGAYIQDLYYCPHEMDKSQPWNASCDCRKPKIGMLLKAQKRYNIDFENSWMIGDTTQDVQTGINAHCHTALLLTGDPKPRKRFPEAEPDFETDYLLTAIRKILGKE